MYKISVPITAGTKGERRAQTLIELKRAKADRVFLCVPRCVSPEDVKARVVKELPEEIAFYTDNGFEVGLWTNSFGHGGSLDDPSFYHGYQNIVPMNGQISTDSFCPLDEGFQDVFARWISALAGTGAKLIMLDDDYRLGYRGSGELGCFCPLHLAKISELLGENVTREALVEKAFDGGPNRYRDAWLKVCGDSMLDFAKMLRCAVDAVDPSVRLGHCAVLDTWDMDGVDSIQLSKAFAGNTKPFLRLIGAAYWGKGEAFGCKIANVIELERMEANWCRDQGIEIFSEGDVFPRPRHNIPAAFLESLDTALRADGSLDGMLKYMIDYSCMPFYERGYMDRHERNLPLYEKIEKMFSGLSPAGIRVYDCMHRLRDQQFPTPNPYRNRIFADFVPASARMLCDNSIPMQYSEDDCTLIFGENARHVPAELLASGAILDGPAAQILTERGFDVGLSAVEGTIGAMGEYYPEENETTMFRSGMYGNDGLPCLGLIPKAAARVVSILVDRAGAITMEGNVPKVTTPHAVSYAYENDQGQRFLVFPFIAQYGRNVSMLFRNYYKQKLLQKQIGWIRRNPMDVRIDGCPDLYILEKRNDAEMAVGLWNMFPDAVYEPKVILGESWSRVECEECTGRLEGNCLTLSDIPPYSFVFFKVSK